jgi:hypothetical protein
VQPEHDWFRFRILPGESRQLHLQFTPPVSGTELVFSVYSESGEWIQGWGAFGPANLPLSQLAAGTYFLDVILLLPSNAPLTHYELTYQPTPG